MKKEAVLVIFSIISAMQSTKAQGADVPGNVPPDPEIHKLEVRLQAVRAAGKKTEEALLLKEFGMRHIARDEYDRAFEHFLNSLEIYENIGDTKGTADVLNKIGKIYKQINEYDQAMSYYERAFALLNGLKEEAPSAATRRLLADTNTYMGNILYHRKDYAGALAKFEAALKIYRETGNGKSMTFPLNNIGTILRKQGRPVEALTRFEESLAIGVKIKDDWEIANSRNNIGDALAARGDFRGAERSLEDAMKLARQIGSLDVLQDSYKFLAALYLKTGNQARHMQYYKLHAETKDVFSRRRSNILNFLMKYKIEKIRTEKEAEIKRQRIVMYAALGVLLLICIFTYFILKEKKRSEKLLLNILPVRVAHDLKKTGKTEPETFHDVTVYFSDIVGFTQMSSRIEPKELIAQLNELFTDFDNIMERNGCERIKTIGDAYLAVCGMPQPDENHAERIVKSAMEIIERLKERNANGGISWNVRIGIHSGKVVGGVVGVKKYIYDVFGDTINTASRMESNSEPMRINVSEATFQILKDKFSFVPREAIEVKGKGKMMMYFLG